MHTKINLIVQPGDSFFPIVRAIDRAERSIDLTVFRMDDPIIQSALVEARHRGVRVRLLIAGSARGWEEKNNKLLKDAKRAGIATKEPSGDSKKARYHYKVMTVDGASALVLTFNPTRENLHYTRDFGIEIYDPAVATEIDRLFEADWSDAEFEPDDDSPLLISPFNSREKMRELLESAEESIRIADAKLEDPAIVQLLVNKARSGVEVRVLGNEKSARKLPKVLDVRAVPRFKLHAKCTIVDDTRAVVGSMNLRTESFDRRREVGILVDDDEVVRRLCAVFESDWQQKERTSSSASTMITTAPLTTGTGEGVAETGVVLISRTNVDARYTLRQGTTSIGRSEENDVVVPEALVSRHHAEISLDERGCVLTDLGSGNGTFVNGERIRKSVRLVPGDVVGIGGAEEFRLIEV